MKLTPTLNLHVMCHCIRFQFARFTQTNERFAVAVGDVIASAGSSQHSWKAHVIVSHAVVWGRVEINQPVVFTGDGFEPIANSLLKLVLHEPHSHGIAVFLLQLCSNVFKVCQ